MKMLPPYTHTRMDTMNPFSTRSEQILVKTHKGNSEEITSEHKIIFKDTYPQTVNSEATLNYVYPDSHQRVSKRATKRGNRLLLHR